MTNKVNGAGQGVPPPSSQQGQSGVQSQDQQIQNKMASFLLFVEGEQALSPTELDPTCFGAGNEHIINDLMEQTPSQVIGSWLGHSLESE